MWTQRDQIQAYQFLRRRLVSALVSADANHPVSPSRRLIMGTLLGVGALLLVTAGFGIAGVLHPASKVDWRKGGQVIVEKGTGARFVLGQDGRLHPVINYASARLLAGGSGSTVTVTSGTLAGAPRGEALGIPSAPDSLPAADRLTAGPWTACSQTAADQPADAIPVTSLLLGVHAAGSALPAGQGVLLTDPAGRRYLYTDGLRYRLASTAATAALGYEAVTAIRVSPAWLSAVPAGADLDTIPVAGSGRPGPSVAGQVTRVGQVLLVPGVGAADGYYLVRTDGLEAITPTQAALVIGDPSNRAGSSRSVPSSAVASAPRSGSTLRGDYPTGVPRLAEVVAGSVVLCAESDGVHGATLSVSARLPLPAGALPTAVGGSSRLTADQVYVAPGRGALVASTQSPGAPPGTTYLVTDSGRKFPIASSVAVGALGYGKVPATPVLSSLLGLIPSGVALDPAAAQLVVAAGAR